MKERINKISIPGSLAAILLFIFILPASAQKIKKLTPEVVVDAMKRSSDYMVNTVSCHGGYLWYYSEDLKERFGEVPARPSQIWVQEPGTPAMGELFLMIYQTTGHGVFLEYAKKAADALIYGQHPMGGWHYFIDFDKPGLEHWYADTASRYIIGWEEYRHYYGNCTYDDEVVQGATRFLLRLYMETLEAVYLPPLRKALDFILISQYPNGGWPQRYPLRYEFAHDGLPDYTSFYTLNDGAMNSIIDVLLEAYQALGNEEYLEAARRGGDFFMISQGPEGYAAWTDQFDMNLQPTAGRTHEPASFQVRYTISTIYELEKLFLFTGDRRYLRPIPDALDWIESVIIGIDDDGQPQFSKYYDPETNYPIIREWMPEVNEEGYMKYKYTLDTTVTYVQYPGKLPIREQYERIRDVAPGMERELYNHLFFYRKTRQHKTEEKDILALLHSMNEKGIWIEPCTVHDITRTMEPNFEEIIEKGFYRYAVKEINGISTHTFIKNMQILNAYLKRNK